MSAKKLHVDELHIDVSLVNQLLKEQFPQWVNLNLELIHPAGTDNVMYRLGSDKVVRLPRTKRSAISLEKEHRWLSKLAPCLPIKIPMILGEGRPSDNYPLPWLICSFLEGQNLMEGNSLDYSQAAVDLGNFVAAMQKIDAKGGPKCRRGQPLAMRNQEMQESIPLMSDLYDTTLLTSVWERALKEPTWEEDPVWIHGDLHAGNLLVENGRVTAVVDFGLAGIGDPASDLMLAWTLLTQETRLIFRSIVKPEEATWKRGRAWAFTLGVVAYPYYCNSNPTFAKLAKRAIDEVLSEGADEI
jgi:aminoglycoside phosphotransferase (APT) family kinase protein